jgi:lipoprotein Spr
MGCAIKHHTKHRASNNIEKKYSKLLGVSKENISNKNLYAFIDSWYGTPYKYGGKTKKGIDCSGFTSILYKEVFEKKVGGPSSSIYSQCNQISKQELREGDLVFFKIDSKEVSHIGIYLQNNKFVHATTKAGVMINDLDEEYYKKYFWGAGRI